MTDLLYQADSYLREFDATVREVEAGAAGVVLDRTAFYPGGGGQPADRGRLEAHEGACYVTGLRRDRGRLLHLLEGGLPEPGAPVTGRLDWERRYALMRTHTALHILCGVVWRDHGAPVTGGNMKPLRGRLDFELDSLGAALIADLEERINAEVEAAREIRVAILDRAEAEQIPDLIRTKVSLLPDHLTEIRTVEIVGLDLQADGGTHVANTLEVGTIRIADYGSKGRGNKRIAIELDEPSSS